MEIFWPPSHLHQAKMTVFIKPLNIASQKWQHTPLLEWCHLRLVYNTMRARKNWNANSYCIIYWLILWINSFECQSQSQIDCFKKIQHFFNSYFRTRAYTIHPIMRVLMVILKDWPKTLSVDYHSISLGNVINPDCQIDLYRDQIDF